MTAVHLDDIAGPDGPAGGRGGVCWALDDSTDLNANLVVLPPAGEIGGHVNTELDVLIVVLAGSGSLMVDGREHRLEPHELVLVPRGVRRAVMAGSAGLRYLTVHRRRGGLGIGHGRTERARASGSDQSV